MDYVDPISALWGDNAEAVRTAQSRLRAAAAALEPVLDGLPVYWRQQIEGIASIMDKAKPVGRQIFQPGTPQHCAAWNWGAALTTYMERSHGDRHYWRTFASEAEITELAIRAQLAFEAGTLDEDIADEIAHARAMIVDGPAE